MAYKTLEQHANEMPRAAFRDHLADLRCQYGNDGIALVWQLERSREALMLETFPIADAEADAAAQSPSHFALLLASAYTNQPLAHRVLKRMVDKCVANNVPLAQELWDYFSWRSEQPIEPSMLQPWRLRERDRIIKDAMRWLIEARGKSAAAGAALIAGLLHELEIAGLGEHGVRKIWNDAKARDSASDRDTPEHESLLAQEAELLRLYGANPPELTFEEYKNALLKLAPKVSDGAKVVELESRCRPPSPKRQRQT